MTTLAEGAAVLSIVLGGFLSLSPGDLSISAWRPGSLSAGTWRGPPAPGAASHPQARAPDEVREAARGAQRRFERVRRRHLPWGRAGYGNRCHEIVGRYCLWHEEDDWEPPPEHPRVTKEREALLAALEGAAAELPADPWIEGQRVRYLVEAGRAAEARRVADGCRRHLPAWCGALAGYALHASGEFAASDAAYRQALRAMAEEERCRWEDVSPLLDRAGRRLYEDLPCEGREAFHAAFWWLADPLYLVPGNERRTEHYVRRTLDRMQERAESGFGDPWGRDLQEILVRYGWPAGWERARRPRSLTAGAGESLIAHDPPGSRSFVPAGRWIRHPEGIAPGEWELDPPRPRAHYAPSYARETEPLDHHLALFRRGESAVLVASYAAGAGDGTPCETTRAGFYLASGPEEEIGRVERTGADGALALEATAGHPLASLEALCPAERRAARARYAVKVPPASRNLPEISGLLLTRGPADSLSEAVERARGGTRARADERVWLYWEVYGLRRGTGAEVTVTLSRKDRGFLRRLAESIGLVDERASSAGLRWTDRAAEGLREAWSRSVELVLPSDLPEGEYLLEVVVTVPGSLPLAASRPLVVERGS